MKIADIKRNCWYQTTQGIGLVERVGGTHPPSVVVNIARPFPRGRVNLKPRDIQFEVADPIANNTPVTGDENAGR